MSTIATQSEAIHREYLGAQQTEVGLDQYIHQGYLPEALYNYLARIEHPYLPDNLLTINELSAHIDLNYRDRDCSGIDISALMQWQHQAIQLADNARLWLWLGNDVVNLVPSDQRDEFATLIKGHISFPTDATQWAQLLYKDDFDYSVRQRERILAAGKIFSTKPA